MGERVGVFLIGAKGNVACTVMVGARALARNLAQPVGLLTESAMARGVSLVGFADLAFGGCDVRGPALVDAAREVAGAGVIPADLLNAVEADLAEIGERVGPGALLGAGETVEAMAAAGHVLDARADLPAVVESIAAQLESFRRSVRARRVVVVNLASTEAFTPAPADLPTPEAVERAVERGERERLSAGALYALAAVRCGMAFVNFTPSAGMDIPGLDAMARRRGVPHAGKDGKTGETLLKTVLAPMFADRALRVHTWHAYNMLGNRDGRALETPGSKRAKLADKDRGLRAILEGERNNNINGDSDFPGADLRTHIEPAPSLGDWKTAMDYVHFEGFLGRMMSLQFTWHGCDSILAAPLVLDLVRLVDLAQRRGEKGALSHLACFFKNPLGTDEHRFSRQVQDLERYLRSVSAQGK